MIFWTVLPVIIIIGVYVSFFPSHAIYSVLLRCCARFQDRLGGSRSFYTWWCQMRTVKSHLTCKLQNKTWSVWKTKFIFNHKDLQQWQKEILKHYYEAKSCLDQVLLLENLSWRAGPSHNLSHACCLMQGQAGKKSLCMTETILDVQFLSFNFLPFMLVQPSKFVIIDSI